jgi:uncharacterized membrane protein YjjP (DUF1212 family)
MDEIMAAVRTKEELKAAVDRKDAEIVVLGELAEKTNNIMKLKKYSRYALVALAVLVASISAAPLTGGTSLFVASPVATSIVSLTGTECAIIVIALSFGWILTMAIVFGYEKVDFKANYGGAEAKLELRRT